MATTVINIDTKDAIKSINELEKSIDKLISKVNPPWWKFWKKVVINITYPDNGFLDVTTK